jgi:Ca2+-binding RTX toxin-like protein
MLNGLAGRDALSVTARATGADNAAFNTVWGGTGNDLISVVTQGHYRESSYGYGGIGNDTIRLNQFGDGGLFNVASFLAGAGNDDMEMRLVATGTYTDRPALVSYGQDGSDTIRSSIVGDNAVHLVDGGEGRDVIRGTASGQDVKQDLWGRHGGDVIRGTIIGTGHSVLRGGGGNDRLVVVGGEGNELYGGQGNDLLILGSGEDVIRFHGGHDRIVGWDRAEDELSIRFWDGEATVTDDGANVRAVFSDGTSVTFIGEGDGTVDKLLDLVDDPGQISDWF